MKRAKHNICVKRFLFSPLASENVLKLLKDKKKKKENQQRKKKTRKKKKNENEYKEREEKNIKYFGNNALSYQ